MKNLLSMLTILSFGVFAVGCSEANKPAAKPAAPAAGSTATEPEGKMEKMEPAHTEAKPEEAAKPAEAKPAEEKPAETETPEKKAE